MKKMLLPCLSLYLSFLFIIIVELLACDCRNYSSTFPSPQTNEFFEFLVETHVYHEQAFIAASHRPAEPVK